MRHRRWARLRLGARVLRLLMLYVLGCWVVALLLLALRAGREAGWGLAPARTPPAQAVPALGVTVELDRLTPAVRAAALDRLARAGFGWVRLRVDWGALEPQPGAYAWELPAALLASVAQAGLQPVVLLDGSPAWARAPADVGAGDQPLAPPAAPADFARFAQAFAARFGSSVRFYQVWDEPNIAPHWGNRHIDPVGYAQLLRAAASAIRAADADAYILTAALAPTADRGHLAIDEPFFVQRMIAAGAAGAFDALAIQPFGFGFAPTNPRQAVAVLNFQRAAVVRRALVAAGLPDVPIWAARFGWNVRGDSPWGTVTPALQSQYAAQARSAAAQWPWLVTLGWAIDQPAAPPNDPIWGFALNAEVARSLGAPPAAPLPAPSARRAARQLALALAAALGVIAAAVYTARPLPWRAGARRLAAAPRWVEPALWAALLITYYAATWPPLIGACGLAAAILIAARPQAGLWLALATLPFYFQHKEIALGDATLAIPPASAAALALIPALLARAAALWPGRASLRALGRTHLRWSDSIAAAWLLISLTPLVNVWQRQAYARGLLDLVIVPLLLYTALRLYAHNGLARRCALAALFAGGLLVALFGLAAWLRGRGVEVDGVRRLAGIHYSPNQTALTLVRALFVGLGLALAVQRRQRALWLGGVGVVAAALLLTASRGALLLGVPAGLAGCLWLWLLRSDAPVGAQLRGLRRRPSVRALLVALPLVVLAALLLGEARLLNRASVDNRLLLWRAALDLWRAFPLLGVGPGGFFWRYPAFLPLGATLEPSLQHPHNVWLELATGWGVLGLIWLAALLVGWLGSAARRMPSLPAAAQWLAIGLAAALLAALAHAQVDAFLALPDLAGWLFAALALASAVCAEGDRRT